MNFKSRILFPALLLAATTVGGLTARAQYREDLPTNAGPMVAVPTPVISDKPNAQIPLDLPFKDSTGADVHLSDYFNHGKPVVLSLVYFSCPMVCGLTQEGLVGAAKSGPKNFVLGKDYDILVVSIDPDDSPRTAADKRANYLAMMDRPASQPGFTYLTGSEDDVKTLADTVGFGYHKNFNPDPTVGKYAHSTGFFVCSPAGRISQTIGGSRLTTDQLYNSLINASQGKLTGGFFYTVGFACGAMRINPLTGRAEANPWFYAGTAGGIVSIIFMATFLSLLFRSDSKRKLVDGPTQDPTLNTQDTKEQA